MSKEEIKALARALAREHSNPEYMTWVNKMGELRTREEHLLFKRYLKEETKKHINEMEEKQNRFLEGIKRRMKQDKEEHITRMEKINRERAEAEETLQACRKEYKDKFCSVEGMIGFSIMGES